MLHCILSTEQKSPKKHEINAKDIGSCPQFNCHNRMGLEKNLEFQRVLHDLPGPSHEFDLKAPFTRQKIFDTPRIEVVRVPKK